MGKYSENNSDKKLKSRLVIKGFEEHYLKEIAKNSPTIDKSFLRIVLLVIAQYNWSVNTIDINKDYILAR